VSNDLPQSAEQSTPLMQTAISECEHVNNPLSPGGRMRRLISKEMKTEQHVYTSFITPTCYYWYAEWQFEIWISICTNDISFTRYRL